MTITKFATIYAVGVILVAIGVGFVNNERRVWPWEEGFQLRDELMPDCMIALGWPIVVALGIAISPFWVPGMIADAVRYLKKTYERKKAVRELLRK